MNLSKLTVFFLTTGFLMLVLAACGPAALTAEQSGKADSENPAEKKEQNTDISADSATDSPADAEIKDTQSKVGNKLSSEVDSKGIAVGFTDDGHAYRGNPDAPVVIEEFSDFQCPFCGRFAAQTMPSLNDNQIAAGEVLLVYYDFPLESIHPQARAAANAARCAGDQGASAFWDMHDALYVATQQWSVSDPNPTFISLAEQLNLDINEFTSCVEGNKHGDKIQADIDLALSRGVRSTPSFFLNGQSLVGAQPVQIFDQAIAAIMGGESIASAEEQSPPQDTAPVLEPPRVAPTPAAINDDNIAAELGDADAPVTIVEFSDYQCPFCQRHVAETMPAIMSDMIETGQVRYVFKDLPLDGLHPEARAAAHAARCAGEQDAYWEMHDALFSSQQDWGGQGAGANDVFVSLAADLSLDEDAFTICIEEERYAAAIQDNVEEARSLGATATPYFFIDGMPIPGAQSYELFFYAVGLAEEGLLADAYGSGEPDTSNSYSIGDPDAPVTIIEYTDFQCPFCSRHFQNTYGEIKKNFIETGKVHYIFKDFPLTNIHPQAVKAAEAARCAGDQDAFLEMHETLFTNQGQWQGRADAPDLFSTYAVELGLDSETFDACLSSGRHEAAVYQDLEEGSNLGVTGTPAFFINGHKLSGAQPYSTFEQAINQFLEEQ